MSGGVDSSVAAALLVEAGEQVVGATMKLWGGPSDSGCCSVADVEDARRVAQQLGIPHHVFNFSEDFGRHVVDPYVADHASGQTPNPCVECNRHLKFDRLLQRAQALGFDAVATGHYARVVAEADGRWSLRRGQDAAKDQSYVLYMLGQRQLSRIRLPIGNLTKDEVRTRASELGLRTAAKPDSQDVCFISRVGGREEFLGRRIDLRPGRVLDSSGAVIGSVPAVELVTIGQRRKLGALRPSGDGAADPAAVDGRRYVIDVDLVGADVTVGPLEALLVSEVPVRNPVWVDGPPADGAGLEAQVSAHGRTARAAWSSGGSWLPEGPKSSEGTVRLLDGPIRRVAPGQSVVLYEGDAVVGGGLAI
jgi:tRNA-specific 2-thiouridylase